jgi:hypothetical protein
MGNNGNRAKDDISQIEYKNIGPALKPKRDAIPNDNKSAFICVICGKKNI